MADDEIVLMAAYVALRREAQQSTTRSRGSWEISRARSAEAAHQALEADLWGRR